ncbi:hypothetical protein ACP4OV_018145 [Aristida adscensionis]
MTLPLPECASSPPSPTLAAVIATIATAVAPEAFSTCGIASTSAVRSFNCEATPPPVHRCRRRGRANQCPLPPLVPTLPRRLAPAAAECGGTRSAPDDATGGSVRVDNGAAARKRWRGAKQRGGGGGGGAMRGSLPPSCPMQVLFLFTLFVR